MICIWNTSLLYFRSTSPLELSIPLYFEIQLWRQLCSLEMYTTMTGWWFQTFLFSIIIIYIYGIILPIDELIFFKMVKTTNQLGLGGAIWCNGVCSLALTGRSVQMWVLKPRVREFGCCDDFHGGWEHRFGLCFHFVSNSFGCFIGKPLQLSLSSSKNWIWAGCLHCPTYHLLPHVHPISSHVSSC